MVFMRGRSGGNPERPYVIIRSMDDQARSRLYFKWFENTVVGDKWVRVVVKFLDDGDAFVLTAFVREILDSGEVLWRKETG